VGARPNREPGVKAQEDLQKAHKRRKNRESLLETLESIVVAFVLAFLFRAFVVEAFVIPTGSMAATLYGAHLEFECSDCGYPFALGYDGPTGGEPRPVCPNCGLVQTASGRVPVYSGDRILVLKFLYDFEPPQRWDVMVFRNPTDPSQNYIKRLVGLPGETLELVRGDVTVNGRIARKTDKAQDSLWMVVHDTRYRPTRRDWTPRWDADKPWQTRDAGFVLEQAPGKDRTVWLRYRHRDPSGRLENIQDFYAYNSGIVGRGPGSNVCTDVALEAEVTAGDAGAVVVADLRAFKDRFRFELPAQGGQGPTRVLVNDRVVAEGPGGVLPVGRPVEVRVANVDRKLVLLVGGRRVALKSAAEVTEEGDPTYEPTPLSAGEQDAFDHPDGDDARRMASEAGLGVRGGPARVAYLRLDRDVYYVNESLRNLRGNGNGAGHGTQGNPFAIEADEYFVCGDNSPKSFDSRLWDLERPVVPRRNLVGKAFFVYWPSAGWRYGLPLAPDLMGFRLVH